MGEHHREFKKALAGRRELPYNEAVQLIAQLRS